MASPIPMEIRACMLEAHNDGATQVEIAEQFNISQSTVSKLFKKFSEDQHLLPRKAKGYTPTHKRGVLCCKGYCRRATRYHYCWN